MTIYRSYAELVEGSKVVELLWDDRNEAVRYFVGLVNYSRCNRVEIWELRSQPDHVFKDYDLLLKWRKDE